MLTHDNILALYSNPLGVMCQSFFRCEAARVLLGGAKRGGESALKPVHCSIAPGSLTGIFRPIVPNAAESAHRKHAEFSGVRAYSVCGGFERRGVKAGPQATAIAARSGLYAS
jgi:hypothetical protein